MLVGHLCIYGKMSIQVLCSFLVGLFDFSFLSNMSSLYALGIILYKIDDVKIYSPIP